MRPGSISKYIEPLVRPTGVPGRVACGFWTALHFAKGKTSPWEVNFSRNADLSSTTLSNKLLRMLLS